MLFCQRCHRGRVAPLSITSSGLPLCLYGRESSPAPDIPPHRRERAARLLVDATALLPDAFDIQMLRSSGALPRYPAYALRHAAKRHRQPRSEHGGCSATRPAERRDRAVPVPPPVPAKRGSRDHHRWAVRVPGLELAPYSTTCRILFRRQSANDIRCSHPFQMKTDPPHETGQQLPLRLILNSDYERWDVFFG